MAAPLGNLIVQPYYFLSCGGNKQLRAEQFPPFYFFCLPHCIILVKNIKLVVCIYMNHLLLPHIHALPFHLCVCSLLKILNWTDRQNDSLTALIKHFVSPQTAHIPHHRLFSPRPHEASFLSSLNLLLTLPWMLR